MNKKSIRKAIAAIIIQLDKPFRISDLFQVCYDNGIKDEDLILDVLDELCDLGDIKYYEISDNCWAYNRIA